ncbi:MAG: MJ1477/TM1410 family putative glycoside hydrolase [candidate division WOR-3 bacterium]
MRVQIEKTVYVFCLMLMTIFATCSKRETNLDINDFCYQLQNIDFSEIGASAFDLVVIDYSQNGDDESRFTYSQISDLKNSSGGNKIVLSYISIGEAENYRWYWHNEWDLDNDGQPDPGAPDWLGPMNPDWEGNYKVKYWDPDWQGMIFASDSSYLDKVIESGFDGVYLDIIDAYEYWGPGGESGLERQTAEQEMVDFVKAIANYARNVKGKKDFLIFPQNGEGLCTHNDYLETISGIGREDVWYNDDTPQPPEETQGVLEDLDVFAEAGKTVLVIDYVRQNEHIDDFYSKAEQKGFVPYATVRNLDSLVINPGHEPD